MNRFESAKAGLEARREAGVGATTEAWRRLARHLFRASDPDRLCEAVCRGLVEDFGFSRALIATIDRERDRLVTRAGYDPSITFPVARALLRLFTIPLQPQPDGRLLVAAWCVLRNEQVHVPDASSYDFRPDETKQRPMLPKVFGAKEYVLTPVWGEAGPLGLVAADKKGQEVAIRPDELGTLEIVATLVGCALEEGRIDPAASPSARPWANRATKAGAAAAGPGRSERSGRGDRDRLGEVLGVLDALHEGLLVLTPGGTVRYLNRAAAGMLDAAPWEAVGKSWREVLPADEETASRLDSALGTGRGSGDVPRRWRLFIPGGAERALEAELLAHPGRKDGGAILLLQDVTETAEAKRAREEYLYMLVHDLNTPLQSVVGFAELLLMERAGELNDTQRDFLERIEASGWEMTQLVGTILQVAELESERVDLSLERLDPYPLLQRALGRAQREVEGPLPEIVDSVPPDLPPIRGDLAKVMESLTTLLGRAIEESGPGGVVRLGGEADEGSGRVRIHILDSGPPLDPETVGRLFDKRWAIEEAPDTASRRRGLRLAVARLVAEAHGGTLEAVGGTEGGARITLSLPVHGGEGRW